MRISMTGEYAVRAMIHLSSISKGKVTHISDISKEQNIPETLLRKIMGQLVKIGLVRSSRGKGGGVMLAKPGDSISLLDIIQGIEGQIILNQCLVDEKYCDQTSYCAVRKVWQQAQDQMLSILNGKSICDLANESNRNFLEFSNNKQTLN
ncbi:MAG: Rrf2 family transcriptional regulator [Candidatus Marinimicrobia bacterium]|nr:Rrf2 family transcriptional regulator [Candidatus Neomarinimicrobiota bacterium]